MKRSTAAALFVIAHVSAAIAKTPDSDYSQRILGEWAGPRHIRAFYADGSFTLDPQPGVPPLGRWNIRGDRLIITFRDDPKPEVNRIIKITDAEMIIEAFGARYTYKRVKHP